MWECGPQPTQSAVALKTKVGRYVELRKTLVTNMVNYVQIRYKTAYFTVRFPYLYTSCVFPRPNICANLVVNTYTYIHAHANTHLQESGVRGVAAPPGSVELHHHGVHLALRALQVRLGTLLALHQDRCGGVAARSGSLGEGRAGRKHVPRGQHPHHTHLCVCVCREQWVIGFFKVFFLYIARLADVLGRETIW